MKKLLALPLIALMAAAAPANAAQVFFDDFSGDSPQQIPTTSLTNFTVAGTVDVVASGNYSIDCMGNAGFCIDLDGTPGPGMLTSRSSFAYVAGDIVTLSYMVSGNQRDGSTDNFSAFLSGNGVNLTDDTTFLGSDPFGTRTLSFVATSNGMASFGFGTTSSDNIGPILDNVGLDITSSVPEPASWALMILGFGLVGGTMRRRKTDTALRFA